MGQRVRLTALVDMSFNACCEVVFDLTFTVDRPEDTERI